MDGLERFHERVQVVALAFAACVLRRAKAGEVK